jgi:DNA-binding MltR family transcriptional regulator
MAKDAGTPAPDKEPLTDWGSIPDNEDDRKEFYSESPDRGMAISLGAIVEDRLTVILKKIMRPEIKLANEIFQPTGPLGNFRTKISLVYLLGLVDKPFYEDLSTVNRIRNRFAHQLKIKSFEQHPICAWIKSMRVYPTLVALRDRPSHPDRKFAKALSFSMKIQLETARDSYRECLRLIIHHLSVIEHRLPDNPPPSSHEP